MNEKKGREYHCCVLFGASIVNRMNEGCSDTNTERKKKEISPIVIGSSQLTLMQQQRTDRESLCVFYQAIRYHFISPPNLAYVNC
jgi:hypothetical protein